MHRDTSSQELRQWPRVSVGPVSKNTVDATIAVAAQLGQPLALIASRRQVESPELGGGYVESWTTAQFVEYVRAHDTSRLLLLGRDHGGPWQNAADLARGCSEKEAMASALHSFRHDIDCGFDLLHIDTGTSPGGAPSLDTMVARMVELYDACHEHAAKVGKPIAFEVGSEEPNGDRVDPEGFRAFLSSLYEQLDKRSLPTPLFVVFPSGTKVLELGNYGVMEEEASRQRTLSSLRRVLSVCQEFRVVGKAHNCDYLSLEGLIALRECGAQSVNVAPEFGVCESRLLLDLARSQGLEKEAAAIEELAYQSRKWEKWMRPQTPATDADRSLIACHYIFSTPAFKSTKLAIAKALERAGVDLDSQLTEGVAECIRKYTDLFQPEDSVRVPEAKPDSSQPHLSF